jgi:hypothetical protein
MSATAPASWEPAPLGELLYGYPLDACFDSARAARDRAFSWGKEEIGEPRDGIEEFMLDNGITHRRVQRPWTDLSQRQRAQAVDDAFERFHTAWDALDVVRRVLIGWVPDDEHPLEEPLGSMDEHIAALRLCERKVHELSDEVIRLADEQRRFEDAQLEAALRGEAS